MEQSLVTLSNGLRLVFCPMPGVESVSIGVWVGVGGRHESDRQTGISHFIEHLLFKGTRTRSAVSISRAIEGRGGDFNAFTQEDATCYYVRMAARHGEIAFAILADMLGDPRFAEADVASEREVIRDEILMYRDQPAQVAEDLLGELRQRWPDGRGLREFLAVGPRQAPFPRRYARWEGSTRRDVWVHFQDHVRTCETLIERWHGAANGRIHLTMAFPTHHPERQPLQGEALATGFVGTRILEGTLIFVGVASVWTVVTLRQDGAGRLRLTVDE